MPEDKNLTPAEKLNSDMRPARQVVSLYDLIGAAPRQPVVSAAEKTRAWRLANPELYAAQKARAYARRRAKAAANATRVFGAKGSVASMPPHERKAHLRRLATERMRRYREAIKARREALFSDEAWHEHVRNGGPQRTMRARQRANFFRIRKGLGR